MPRTRLLAVAMVVAAGAIGCAHCDTCDDFPAPCVGGNCMGSAPGYSVAATPTMVTAPIETAPMTGYIAPTPAAAGVSSQPPLSSTPTPSQDTLPPTIPTSSTPPAPGDVPAAPVVPPMPDVNPNPGTSF